jgi:hypothetical protein
MITFHHKILKALSGYKSVLKKKSTTAEYTTKLKQFGIKHSTIKKADEMTLYKIGTKIVAALELESELKQNTVNPKCKNPLNSHYGEKNFLHYLKKLLGEYVVENERIISINQKSSCLLITLIQLISNNQTNLSDETFKQVCQYSNFICKHGTNEQKKLLKKALTQQPSENLNSLYQQLQIFLSDLDESSPKA